MKTNVSIPATHSKVTLEVVPQEVIQFDFNADAAKYTRSENNLVIEFANDATVVLNNFFVGGEVKTLPNLQMADGSEISGESFLQAMNPDIDLSVAAGPAASANSGGVNAYSDDSGSLVSGLDRLGSLGTSGFARSASLLVAESDSGVIGQSSVVSGSGTGGGASENTVIPPVTPVQPSPPVHPETPVQPEDPVAVDYHTRLVLTHDAGSSHTFMAVLSDGTPVTNAALLSLALDDPNNYFNAPIIDPVTGKITVTLSPDGQAALANGEDFNAILTIDTGSGSYPMELKGKGTDASYDAADEEASTTLPGHLVSEMYSSDQSVDSADIKLTEVQSYNEVGISSYSDSDWTFGIGNTNIVLNDEARGVVNVTAKSSVDAAYGVLTNGSDASGSSSIIAGDNSDIHIKGSSNGSGGVGVFSYADSGAAKAQTSITGGDILIEGVSRKNTAAGIWAKDNSDVNVDAKGDLVLHAKSTGASSNNVATAAYATAGTNNISLTGHNIYASSDAVKLGGSNNVSGSIALRANAGSTLTATTEDGGKLVVSAYQEVSLSDTGYTYNHKPSGFTCLSVVAYDRSSTGQSATVTLNSSDIELSSTIDSNSAKGATAAVYAGFNGKVVVNLGDAGSKLAVNSSAPSWSVGVFATNSGTTAINGGGGNDNIEFNNITHNGILAMGVGTQASGNVVIDGGAGHDSLTINSIFTGTAASQGTDVYQKAGAYGLAGAWGSCHVLVKNMDEVTINADASASTDGSAYGMYSHNDWGYNEYNKITSDNAIKVTIVAKAGTLGDAYAMYSAAGVNIIQGGSHAGDLIGDEITLTGSIGTGNNGGGNFIGTGSGNDSVILHGDIKAAAGSSYITVSTGLGDDSVVIHGDVQSAAGKILLDTGAGDDLLHIDGSISSSNATNDNNSQIDLNLGGGNDSLFIGDGVYNSGVHKISIDMGSGNDTVEIQGGLHGSSTGQNLLNLGNGDDKIHIVGSIDGHNEIDAGNGDDIIHLHGSIGNGSLALDGGSGHDTLILTADDFSTFHSFYDQWLSSSFHGASIEAVHIELANGSASDIASLQSYITSHSGVGDIFHDVNITYAHGDVLNMSGYLDSNGDSTFNLGDILDNYDHQAISVLDLSGGHSNTVTIDSLLSVPGHELTINGDASDTIQLNGSWSTDHHVDNGYLSHSNGEDTILIQQGIIINSGG